MKKSLKIFAGCIALFSIMLTGCDGGKKDPGSQEQPVVTTVHVTSVALSPKTLTLDIDQTQALTATVLPENATDKSLIWTTSDRTVATVSDAGVVTAIFEGNAIITAKSVDGELTDTCTVTVNEAAELHYCTHVCPTCGKCLDPNCTDPVCADKCQGHEPELQTLSFTTGKVVLEAEDSTVSGTMTGSDPTDAFVGQRTSDNPSHPTSGGSLVFNWAKQGNKITWKFKLDEAESDIGFKLWVACGNTQNSSNLKMSVNNTKVDWNESTVVGKGSENKWYYWQTLTGSGSLVKGVNTIVVENLSDLSWNIDCLEMVNHVCNHVCSICGKCTDPNCTNALCLDKCTGHHQCQHVCPTCGKCTDASCTDPLCADKCKGHSALDLSSGYQIFESEDGFNYSGCKVFSNENASGGKAVGSNWSYGNYYEFEVNVSEEVSVTFSARGTVVTPLTTNNNGLCEIHIDRSETNHENIGYGQWSGSQDAWHNYSEFVGHNVATLTAGTHIIRVVCPFQTQGNIDYVKICAVSHTCSHVCEYCGKCTDANCSDAVCSSKCSGHPVLDLSSGYQIFESEDAFEFYGCQVYSNEAAHGGKGVGGDWRFGSYYKFDFIVTSEVTVKFNACGSVCTDPMDNDNGLCEIRIDGETNLENIGSGEWSGGNQAWHTYIEFVGKKSITLSAGRHIVKVFGPTDVSGNMDYVKILKAN